MREERVCLQSLNSPLIRSTIDVELGIGIQQSDGFKALVASTVRSGSRCSLRR
jgi:hypothetical protein